MWRNLPPEMATGPPLFAYGRVETGRAARQRRIAERRRQRVAEGLLRVARRSAPSAPVRRSEVLLTSRAATVRVELLELAVLVRTIPNPDPDAIITLHTMLTDGCASPLYNRGVPAERLPGLLSQARAQLSAAATTSQMRQTHLRATPLGCWVSWRGWRSVIQRVSGSRPS